MSPETGLLASQPQRQSPWGLWEGTRDKGSACCGQGGGVARRSGVWIWNHTTWVQIPVLPPVLDSAPALFVPQFPPAVKQRRSCSMAGMQADITQVR